VTWYHLLEAVPTFPSIVKINSSQVHGIDSLGEMKSSAADKEGTKQIRRSFISRLRHSFDRCVYSECNNNNNNNNNNKLIMIMIMSDLTCPVHELQEHVTAKS